MAAKQTTNRAKLYGRIGDELASSPTGVPTGSATFTNFKALANMSTAGAIEFEARGTTFVIPLLLNS